MLFLELFIIGLLILIAVQDFRSRSVYWFLFPGLTMLFLLLDFLQHRSLTGNWQAIVINISLLILQFLLVSVYFSVKNRQWTNITSGLIGWGDILFLLSITFYLSVLNFLLFYITSLTAILLVWLFWQLLIGEKNKQIPLAGFQALIFIVFLASDWFFGLLDLTNDDQLLHLIMK